MMRFRKSGLFLFLGAAAVAVGSTFSCSSKSCVDEPNPDTACCAPLGFDAKTGTCQAASGDAALEGGADALPDVVPAGCDPTASPKDAPKCVVSEFGVFVDVAGGDEGNAGTKESPVKSIGGALAKLGTKSRVYVCEGTYDEM